MDYIFFIAIIPITIIVLVIIMYLANLYTLFFSNLIHLTFTPLTVCIN